VNGRNPPLLAERLLTEELAEDSLRGGAVRAQLPSDSLERVFPPGELDPP